MKKLPQRSSIDIYHDIDLTLIDKDDIFRPHIAEYFSKLHRDGYNIFFWSGGGVDYCTRQVIRLMTYINHGRNEKLNLPRYILPKLFSSVRYKDERSICLDDQWGPVGEFTKFGGLGIKMSEYDHPLMPDDRELLKAYETIREYRK